MEPITRPYRHIMDVPMLTALTPPQWDAYELEPAVNRYNGMNLGGCSVVRLESLNHVYVVIRNRHLPAIKCPRHPTNWLEINQTIRNSSYHPENCVFYGCNITINGNLEEICGFNIYPLYPIAKFAKAVVASGGDVNGAPVMLEYDGLELH